MRKKILVAVDDSIRAAGVLAGAAELANASGGDLHLVRVLTMPPELPDSVIASIRAPLAARLTEQAQRDLAELARRTPKAMVAEILVPFGRPDQAILDTAAKIGADLIVLGSHGYRGWDHVLGTTVVAVANLATCDVLILHDRRSPA